MGYYNEIGIYVDAKHVEGLINAGKFTNQQGVETNIFDVYAEKPYHKDDKGNVLYLFYEIKWNEFQLVNTEETDSDKPKVEFKQTGPFFEVKKYLTSLLDEEYLFIRIGEEFNDIEICGAAYDNSFDFYLSREMVIGDTKVQ